MLASCHEFEMLQSWHKDVGYAYCHCGVHVISAIMAQDGRYHGTNGADVYMRETCNRVLQILDLNRILNMND